MRTAAFGLALLAASGLASARAAFEADCDDAAHEAGATFSTRASGWRIDNTVSYRDLTRMKRPGVRNGYVLGLTRKIGRAHV